MGQKVNPHGLRVGVIKDWDSRWFTGDHEFGDTLVSDFKVRKYLKETLQLAGVPQVEIERVNDSDGGERVRVFIHCAKPGMIIGRQGAEIEKLRVTLEKMFGHPVSVNVIEIRTPDMNAQLVAENIASQLERRISFRRAMKQCIGRTMRCGAKGIKICVSGRLGGAEIARTEHYHEGTIPLQTLRADIDYGFWEANTTYGKIGIKVWIYKGEILNDGKNRTVKRQFVTAEQLAQRAERRDRRGDRGPRNFDNRNGDRRPPRQGGFNNNRGQGGFNNNRGGQGGFNNNRRPAPAPRAQENTTKGDA